MSAFTWIVLIAIAVLIIAGWWKMFEKAGQEGWKAIIPIYNVLTLLKIVGREWWWILLMLIPFVGFIVWIIVLVNLATSFGRGGGFAVGLIFLLPIFALILGVRERHPPRAGGGGWYDSLTAKTGPTRRLSTLGARSSLQAPDRRLGARRPCASNRREVRHLEDLPLLR